MAWVFLFHDRSWNFNGDDQRLDGQPHPLSKTLRHPIFKMAVSFLFELGDFFPGSVPGEFGNRHCFSFSELFIGVTDLL